MYTPTIEFTNLSAYLKRSFLDHLVFLCISRGMEVEEIETERYFIFRILKKHRKYLSFYFKKEGKGLKLYGTYHLNDPLFVKTLETFLYRYGGNGVIKRSIDGELFIELVENGDPIRVTKVRGMRRHVVFEHPDIKKQLDTNEQIKNKINYLSLEIDYYLSELNDAIKSSDDYQIRALKHRLTNYQTKLSNLKLALKNV